MRISDWSSDVCSSDLRSRPGGDGGLCQVDSCRGLSPFMAASCMQPAGRGYRRAKLSASRLRFGLGPEHHDAVGARLRRPDLALAPQHLPHGGIPAVAREAFETLGLRIEAQHRSEEHTSEIQSLMRISYDVFY